ncbi:molybdopterin oxidoreductase [Chthoniobacter flavus Ellin428]|uniref:Molybdopterin oxidoreductase n=1 Tax=Chthoniobacter flavus Ellin428 TaxID=497964 RepID=B4CV15_9BACT|nr:molybdopterin-dependent oxidoreductase [Chthoniobacter flavus]EDY22403.1 molybdopterin oxidoreductase [Chthoniobacter flavus Ellin428]TCO94584.1 NADH-quinone oxidoreductase subunit G [Chthoniobacter flavus]
MSTETAAPVQMLNVQVDGVWHQFPKGTRVIEACSQAGKYVPRYCYHPKLSSPGNCRMCLVEMGMPKMTPDRKPVVGADGKPEIAWIPRPQISCAQDVAEGMGIRTDSPMAKECRQGVMEFLLINHPLDCPICDQAGECRLQEFSVEYGQGESRFLEHKVKKPKNVELGPRVTLDAERCILCTRCIRFMKEVAHDDVLGIVDRGSYNSIACHPERVLDNNYSLNTVDICPVGALTSTDFRFKMRVWFLKETKTVDVNCGTGSNITIGSRENKIYRITPRENNDVNGVWLPDSHRLNFKYVADAHRLHQPTVKGQPVEWRTAIAIAAEVLKSKPSEQIWLLASGRQTNEELFLTTRLVNALNIKKQHDILPRNGTADGLLIAADRNPNTNGAKVLGLTTSKPGGRLKKFVEGVRAGTIKVVITMGEDLTKAGLTEEDLAKLDAIIALDILPNKTTPHATVLLPASAWVEKRGSMINLKGRLQRLNRAVNAPGEAHDDWEILRDLIQAVSGSNGLYMIEDVFKSLAAEVKEFAGLNLSKIGDLGVQVIQEKTPEPEPAEAAK